TPTTRSTGAACARPATTSTLPAPNPEGGTSERHEGPDPRRAARRRRGPAVRRGRADRPGRARGPAAPDRRRPGLVRPAAVRAGAGRRRLRRAARTRHRRPRRDGVAARTVVTLRDYPPGGLPPYVRFVGQIGRASC